MWINSVCSTWSCDRPDPAVKFEDDFVELELCTLRRLYSGEPEQYNNEKKLFIETIINLSIRVLYLQAYVV